MYPCTGGSVADYSIITPKSMQVWCLKTVYMPVWILHSPSLVAGCRQQIGSNLEEPTKKLSCKLPLQRTANISNSIGLPLQYKSACPRERDDYLMTLPGLPTTNYSRSHTAEHSQFLRSPIPFGDDSPGDDRVCDNSWSWEKYSCGHPLTDSNPYPFGWAPSADVLQLLQFSQWYHCNAKIDLAPWSSISAPASTSATRSGSLIQMSKNITIHQWRWCLLIQVYMERTSKTCIAISVL